MVEIDDLRQRVEAAQERFGLLDEQQKQYSERLVGLMDVVDDGIRQQRAETDDLHGEVQRLSFENDELKSMLQALLRAMEEGSTTGFADTMRTLESRAGALVEATESSVALPKPTEEADDAPENPPEPEDAAESTQAETVAEESVEDVPVTPPTPWDDEAPSASEEEPAQADSDTNDVEPETASDDEPSDGNDDHAEPDVSGETPTDEADTVQTESGSHAVEDRVKRLIEMTEMSPSKSQS